MPSPELTTDSLPEAAEVYPLFVQYIQAMHAAALLPKREIVPPQLFATNLWGHLTDDHKRDYLKRWERGIIEAPLVENAQLAYRLYLQSQEVRRRVETVSDDLTQEDYQRQWEAMEPYRRLHEVHNYQHVIDGTPLEESAADIIKRYMRRRRLPTAN